jgi:hypothetical protein
MLLEFDQIELLVIGWDSNWGSNIIYLYLYLFIIYFIYLFIIIYLEVLAEGFKGEGEGWRGQTTIGFIIAYSGHKITRSKHKKISSLMLGWAFLLTRI